MLKLSLISSVRKWLDQKYEKEEVTNLKSDKSSNYRFLSSYHWARDRMLSVFSLTHMWQQNIKFCLETLYNIVDYRVSRSDYSFFLFSWADTIIFDTNNLILHYWLWNIDAVHFCFRESLLYFIIVIPNTSIFNLSSCNQELN